MASKATTYTVLITDDDRGSREALRDIVVPEGFTVSLAGSGEEALEIVQRGPVHVAFFDMHMPTLSGLETMQLARQINAALPCILITADSSEGLVRQAFFANAFTVIPKPVSKNVVLYTVTRVLSRFYGPPRPGTDNAGDANR